MNHVPSSISIDNRSPQIRLTDDITSLARMASINFGMIEEAFNLSRAVAVDKDRFIYTLNFSVTSVDQLHFAASDLQDRARSIADRASLIEDVEEDREPVTAASPGAFDRYDLLSTIEGALAILSGLSEAIDELSSEKQNPERRLSAICAIGSSMHDEIERAKQACRDLYEGHFSEKSTG